MRCKEVQNLLVEYVSDESAPGTADRVAGHLETCSACRESARELRLLLSAIWDSPAIEPTHHELAVARTAAREALAPRIVRRPAFAPLGRLGDWAFALASVLVLALAVAVQQAFSESGLLRAFLADVISHRIVLVVCFVWIAVVASFLPICLIRKGVPNGAYNGL